jgi:hypothetical protein
MRSLRSTELRIGNEKMRGGRRWIARNLDRAQNFNDAIALIRVDEFVDSRLKSSPYLAVTAVDACGEGAFPSAVDTWRLRDGIESAKKRGADGQ